MKNSQMRAVACRWRHRLAFDMDLHRSESLAVGDDRQRHVFESKDQD